LAGTPTAILPAGSTPPARRARDACRLNDPIDATTAVLITTSGSTGHPRAVMCSADALTAFTNGPRLQWIAALPLFSMGGLNVVLRGLAHDLPPVALPSLGGAAPFDPADLAQAVAAAGSDAVAVSLVPTQFARCLSHPDATAALQDCHTVLVGGARVPPAMAEAAHSAGITITQTYGATEVCGGCVYDGMPLPGVRVTVESNGRIVLGGPMVTLGYRNEPELTAELFTDAGFRTSDLGAIDGDGRLQVLGRMDDVVSITGVNVSTGAVEDAITALPQVDAVAVTVHGDGEHTPYLRAWVSGTVDADVVRAHVRTELGPAAVPKWVHHRSDLPMLANGKVDYVTLREAGEAVGDRG
jgi:O-succinylbenzoic acid--CoA ligase